MIEAVLVVWRDAHADQSCQNWCSVGDLDCGSDYLVRTVGWRIVDDSSGAPVKTGHVTLAQSFGTGTETASIADVLLDSVLHIPNENVVSVLSLMTHRCCSQTE